MTKTGTAKVTSDGLGQLVHLPDGFRLPCAEVRVSPIGDALLLEPVNTDIDAWLARLRELADPDFPDRDQPPSQDVPDRT